MAKKLFLLLLLGCATLEKYPPYTYKVPVRKEDEIKDGIYYKVRRGDTLYRIAQNYGIELKELQKINKIANPNFIREGQLIYIPKKSSKEHFIWPLKGKVISYFGDRKYHYRNRGIDIKAMGNRKVVAAKSGKVCFTAENVKGYGKIIIINHGDGLYSLYAYNDKIFVRKGQWVKQGEVIAIAGTTGKLDIPTLHFEIRRGYKAEDPLKYLP